MGKETKIKIKYRYGQLPEGLCELLNNADEADMRILVALMMLADKEGGEVSPEELCEALRMDSSEVRASLKFWRGAGIVENASAKKAKAEEQPPKVEKEKPKSVTAHRNGVIEKSNITEDYSARELADIMEKRIVTAELVDEAQRIMGKMFRTYDIGILVGIVERLGYDEEAVLVILNYIAGKGKKTMRYAETLAMALYDEGITETSAVIERIGQMERAGEVVAQIKTLYGIGDRALTATEKRLFSTWTESFAYDIEVIRLAYDITVDNTQKPVPKYTNTILEHWNSEGLRTADEVRKYLDRQKSEKSGGVAKSYDADDFFEAALQRSYEELK